MYDELVKRLRSAESNYQETLDCLSEAADAIEELSKKYLASEVDNTNLTGWLAEEHAKHLWIPVTERLPEDLTRVIVFCEDGVSYGLCEHLIADDEEVVEWHDFLYYPIMPTYWMPLPQPPESESE